jgi:hypothetical protein
MCFESVGWYTFVPWKRHHGQCTKSGLDMTTPDTLYRTAAAAHYLSNVQGIQCSPHTLRKWRRRGAEHDGERGPEWRVDPMSGHAFYAQSELDRFAEFRRARLKKARIPQPEQLENYANGGQIYGPVCQDGTREE